MKKIISLALVLLMCLTTLIACGGTGDDVTTPADVTTPNEPDVTTPAAILSDMTKGDLEGETIKFLAQFKIIFNFASRFLLL